MFSKHPNTLTISPYDDRKTMTCNDQLLGKQMWSKDLWEWEWEWEWEWARTRNR